MGAVFISSLACGRLVHPSTALPRGSKIASSNGLAGTDIDLRFYKAWSTLCIILLSRASGLNRPRRNNGSCRGA